ncbi:MAG: hypothetical protein WA945_10290 [Arcobacteraceae bacterium]
MKANIITDEQLEFLSNDIAEMVSRLEKIKEDFDAKGIKEELVKEIRKGLQDNSIFSKLEEEDLDLRLNLNRLKRVGEDFKDCANEKLIKTVIVVLISAFVGGLISAIALKFFI